MRKWILSYSEDLRIWPILKTNIVECEMLLSPKIASSVSSNPKKTDCSTMPIFENKLSNRAEILQRIVALPKPVVMTNGVFDILHRGHVTYLAQARALGASLVVAVNTDASVKRLGKGDDRPLNTCADRMAVLAALESVSLVVEFDEDTALQAVEAVRPNIYVKGGDYDMTSIPEGQAVLTYGGRAVAIDFEHDRSTSKLLAKVRSQE